MDGMTACHAAASIGPWSQPSRSDHFMPTSRSTALTLGVDASHSRRRSAGIPRSSRLRRSIWSDCGMSASWP
jgi:hypothetical protein